jgi:type I restriction enzyme, S subunit
MAGKNSKYPPCKISDLAELNPPVVLEKINAATEVSFIPMSDVSETGRWIVRQTRTFGEIGNGYTAFQEGDVLFAKITPCMENGKGCHAVNLVNGVGFGSTEFHVLRAKADSDAQFIFHLTQFENLRLKAAAEMVGSAGQQRVPSSFFSEYEVIKPEPAEQTRIAAVLSCIDRAIEQTEALIAKQQRIKTGLMQDLLTKGIDEHGNIRSEATHEFKDSPLGRIPKEWDAVPLKEALEYIDAGKSPTCLTRPAGAGEWGILKVSAIRPEGFKASENKAVKSAAHINKAYEVKNGDLLISRANTYELVGIVCFVHNPIPQLMLCDKTLRLNVDKERAATEFLFHVLQMPSVRSQIEINATGSSGSMKNISQTTIENLLIPLPLLDEQEMIIRRLNSHGLFSSVEVRKREKLTRIKQGLMQDLLKGKVSVESLLADQTAAVG